MDITKSIVSSREKALLYGDYATYRSLLAGKLLNCRKKLNIATKSRGKYNPKVQVTAEQVAENHGYGVASHLSSFYSYISLIFANAIPPLQPSLRPDISISSS
jgi:RNA-binding signal recognition particle 68